jgi:hypothetical protein
MSDYEEAIEKLKNVKVPHGWRVRWWLHAHCDGGPVDWWVEMQPFDGSGFLRSMVHANGKSPLDAACAAIDQFRNSLLKEEEEKKIPVAETCYCPCCKGRGEHVTLRAKDGGWEAVYPVTVNLPPASEGRGIVIRNSCDGPLLVDGSGAIQSPCMDNGNQ